MNLSVLVVLFFTFSTCLSLFPETTVPELDSAELKDVKIRKDLQLVHFFTNKADTDKSKTLEEAEGDATEEDDDDDDFFMRAYVEASNYMVDKGYSIPLYKFNCAKNSAPECKKKNFDKLVHLYSRGDLLVTLGTDTMFDVPSIVSNILQLYALDDIKIFRTQSDAELFESQCKNASINGFIGYVQSFGTYDHMYLLETLVPNLELVKFEITTTPEAVKHLPDFNVEADSQVWLVQCKNVPADAECNYVKYRLAMEVESFSKFVNFSYISPVIRINSKDDLKMLNVSHVHLFHKTEHAQEIDSIAGKIANQYFGQLIVLKLNIDEVDPNILGLDNSVRNYPVLSVKPNDMMKTYQMSHAFSEENCLQFVLNRLIKGRKSRVDVNNLDYNIFDGSYDVVQMQDDEIAIGVMSLGEEKIESILSHWKQLTDQTFPKIMKDDLHLVTFFVMWSHPSTSLLHSIIKTSEKYPDQINTNYISTVNCLDWTDVCGMQNVSRYPTVHFYRKGQLSQYTGILDGKSVIASMKLLKLDSPLILNDKTSVEDFLNWRNPDLKDFVGTIVFGAFNKGTKGYKVFIDAATKQHGKILFGLADGDSAKESCKKFGASFPCIVLLRKDDAVQPYVVYNGNIDADDIIKYITYEKVPLYSELNSKTFPLLYNRAQPLVVLFLDVNNHDAPVYSKAMTNVAASRKFNEYTFNWMNVHSVDSVGSTILEFYVKDPRIPTLILLDKKSESVYIYKQTTITEEGISSWLTQLQMGKIEADVLLKKREFKPLHPGYDLKKLRSTEFETTSADQEDIDLLNEHGFGFDGDNQYHTNDKSSNQQDEDKSSEDALIYDENKMENSATDTKEEQRMTEEINEDIEVLQKTGILKSKGKEKEPLKIIERGRTIKNKKQNSKDHQEL